MSLHQREHFNQLYEGTNQMIHDLCKEGSYQEGTYVFYIIDFLFAVYEQLLN